METKLVEGALLKICNLMAIGFGEAGEHIISHNIKLEGDLDPMLKGKKVIGIFGFCDIRNFTDTTEVLKEKVMLFVNTIGKIVHKNVDLFCGGANKNVGDAFLLVWKVPDDEVVRESDDSISLRDPEGNYIQKLSS